MERERLTITLKKEIVNSIDRMIDGAKIRNRSHAIEYLLGKNFLSEKTKVIILTGGKGIKMRPFTYEMPKVLLPIKNKPLLQHTIESLARGGFRDIIISTGYLGEKIKNYFKDGNSFGVKISYSKDKKENGTTQPLFQTKKLINKSLFVLWYGDVLAKIDLLDMLNFHRTKNNLITMAITSVEKPSNWGVVSLKGTDIVNFKERPSSGENSSHLINAGVYVMEPEIFEHISAKSRGLEIDILPKLAKEKNLSGYFFSGQWFDVGSLENYERAVKKWSDK